MPVLMHREERGEGRAGRIRRRELTPIGAYTTLSQKYTSELWGDQVYWPGNGGQWVYAGYIWLESSKSYKFRATIDDADRIVITDSGTGVETVLISDTTHNTVDTSAAYSPSVQEYLRNLAEINRQAAEMADRVIEVVYSVPVALKGEIPCV